MRNTIFIVLFIFSSLITAAQSTDSTLDVACWNIEWFGAASNGPTNDDLQEKNVATILKWMDADIYGLVEVVDTMRFRRLVDELGRDKFDYIISPYCSNTTTNTSNAWLAGQKLAFIYRKSVFSNVTSRGLLRASSTAYTSWASGRFPFMLSATVTMKGVSKEMNFIVIHGKAGDTESDHNRRLAGAKELKDSLDTYYSTASIFLIGDYNDALNTAIYKGATTSSFLPFVMDSTDTDHYKSITLAISTTGRSSMINYPNIVDNHIISNEVAPYYIPASVKIVTDVTKVVPDYITANQTSDHYPVISHYKLVQNIVTNIPTIPPSAAGIRLWPNPSSNRFLISFANAQNAVFIDVLNLQGKSMYSVKSKNIQPGIPLEIKTPQLPAGIYQVIIQTNKARVHEKLLIK